MDESLARKKCIYLALSLLAWLSMQLGFYLSGKWAPAVGYIMIVIGMLSMAICMTKYLIIFVKLKKNGF